MAEAPYRWKALERVSCQNGTVQGSYFSASALRGREARFDLLGQRSHVRLHEDIFVRAGDDFDVHTLSGEIARLAIQVAVNGNWSLSSRKPHLKP